MKKINTLLIITLCFSFMITTTCINTFYELNPLGHYTNDNEDI